MLSSPQHEATQPKTAGQVPVLAPGHNMRSITDKISDIVLKPKGGIGWVIGFAITFALTMQLLFSIGWLLLRGIGVWGNNQPASWAFDIINFVWFGGSVSVTQVR
ncbi:MAG: hypothetical protein KDD73_03955 [Anaerolineales bacterium]|nr:hypothetical protein [Anaerolineales bacterium]